MFYVTVAFVKDDKAEVVIVSLTKLKDPVVFAFTKVALSSFTK